VPTPARDRSHVELQRIHHAKRPAREPTPLLGPELLSFFKHSIQKRQTKLSKIAECWCQLVPEMLLEHCALESFHAGTLKVIVDSAAHLYELKQLLLAGMQTQILLACKSSGLRRITLRQGRWYQGDDPRERKLRFD
jgi:hypothetical protein